MADYNILLASDKNYIFYMMVTCQSIINSLEDWPENSQDKIIFYVITDQSVTPKVAKAVVDEFTLFNANSKVAFKFDFLSFKPDVFANFQQMQKGEHTTTSTYYRIIFDRFIPRDVERILYLDVDIMICADIRRLFKEYPMGDEVLYAAPTTAGFCISNNANENEPVVVLKSKNANVADIRLQARDYFNAGLLIYNTKQWREQNIEATCLNIGQNWQTQLYDQDLLNAACVGKISYISPAWNFSFSLYSFVITENQPNQQVLKYADLNLHPAMPDFEGLTKISENPYGVHFTNDKPWYSLLSPSILDYFEQCKMNRIDSHLKWHKIFKELSSVIRTVTQAIKAEEA